MDEMLSALRQILGDIRTKTGVEASLEPQGGEETRVEADWHGSGISLYVKGSGESAEREARLVAYLLREDPAQGGREERLRELLLGGGGEMAAFRFLSKYRLADGKCTAFDVLPDRRIGDALEHIERCLDGGEAVIMDRERIAVVRFASDGQTDYEFAKFLCQSLYEEAGIRAQIGLGCEMGSFKEIALSYEQAVSATRMSGMFRDSGQIHSYREFLLVRAMEDIPKEKLREYLGQFRITGAEELFCDEELIGTAEAFLQNDLNLSETSRALYIHRNTLSYRLDKIERVTGLNIRKFPDAVTFRVLGILIRMLGR